MTDDLFNANTDDQVQIDQNKNYLDELVGEDKKFKTPEDLAKGKAVSDSYIKVLERRLDEMRNDYTRLDGEYKAGASLRELFDQMQSQKQQLASSEQNPNANEVNNQQPTFDPKQIETLVSSEIQKNELKRKQDENYKLFQDKLTERFGDSAKTILRSQLEQLGINEEFARNLAMNNPNFLLKAIGANNQETRETFQPPIASTDQSRSFIPNTGPKRTWTYYQKMKKENPTLYRSPKITVQMQQDYATLGAQFEDGDFHR